VSEPSASSWNGSRKLGRLSQWC